MEPVNFNDIETTEVEVVSDFNFKNFMDRVDPTSTPTVSYKIPEYDLTAVKVGQNSIDVILDLHRQYNKEYGLDLKFSTDDVAKMFQSIIAPDKKKIMELYLSETYSRVRLVLYQKLIFGVMQLVEDVTSPSHLSEPLETKVILLEKLLDFLAKINEIYEQLRNDHVEDELQKLASESKSTSQSYDYKDPQVQEILKQLDKTILEQ